jgi:serine protease Do
MRRTFLFVIVTVVIACVGGVVGSIVTMKYLNDDASTYSSIEQRQQLVLAANKVDSSFRVPKDLIFFLPQST